MAYKSFHGGLIAGSYFNDMKDVFQIEIIADVLSSL